MRFDPTDKIIVLGCMKEILFVTFEGGLLKTMNGIWEKNNLPQSVLSIAFIDNNAVTGMFKG
jgi:hypothetical protein